MWSPKLPIVVAARPMSTTLTSLAPKVFSTSSGNASTDLGEAVGVESEVLAPATTTPTSLAPRT